MLRDNVTENKHSLRKRTLNVNNATKNGCLSVSGLVHKIIFSKI